MSALYGAVRPTDRIAAYRLAMGTTLPDVGALAATWRPALDQVLPPLVGPEGREQVVFRAQPKY